MTTTATIGETFANPAWFSQPEQSEVFLSAYRPMRVAGPDLATPIIRDLGPWVRCVFFYGTMTYYDGGAARIVPMTADQWHIDLSDVVFRETAEGPHTVLASPSRIDGVEIGEETYRERAEGALGLLLAFEGRNIAHSRLFEMKAGIAANQLSAVSPTFENPLTFPAPDMSPTRLELLVTAGSSIDALSPDVRSRVELSLRWYEQGMASIGIDAFIRLWIAIETLCMPNTTDIRPLVALLARASGLEKSEIRERYKIGRVFGLRGLIVHNGGRPAIHAFLLDFLGAVYGDALAETLGIQTASRISAVFSQPGFDLRSYLP
jgi:hypothetical protein